MHRVNSSFKVNCVSHRICCFFFLLYADLKRFSETRWSKLTNIVEFPTGERELNMAPYAANSASVQYSLYGICNHMGKENSYFLFEIPNMIFFSGQFMK